VVPFTIVHMEPGPAPPASSPAATRTMKANRRRDTLPELRVRRALHGLGLRFLVDVPVPGTSRRRRADVLLRGARIALYVDGCFWRSCLEHQHLPRANREWWQRKLDSIIERDIHTDAAVHAVGWWPLRIWEHEDPVAAAKWIAHLANARQGARGQAIAWLPPVPSH
jgi:DNA mismatch endonuclease (patch repair protein)